MDSFEKILSRYEYADHMKAGGFVIDGKPALTGIDPSLIGDYVIMTVRDPLLAYESDPAELLGERMTDCKLAGKSGMFTTVSGYYGGAHISIVSGGSGSPEAELVLVEFMHYTQANTFIRLGGAGGINSRASVGDVVIASSVVRDEGMTREYIPSSFPAASSYEVVLAMAQGAEDTNASYAIGTARSSDSEHVGVGRPSVNSYIQPWHLDTLEVYDRAGVLYTDRESAAVVTLCNLFGRRGGAVCSVGNNLLTGEDFRAGVGQEKATDTVFAGLKRLHEMDEEKKRFGRANWTPSLGKR